MQKRNKLAIFDLDGTLFDTKNVNFNAYSQAIGECGFKVDIDYQYYCEFCNGNNYRTFLPTIITNISDQDMQRIHDIKKELYPNCLCYAEKNEHLFSLISLIKEEYVIALVTTASRKNTNDILQHFGVASHFDFIICQEDVCETKPSPEGFVKAMEIAKVDKNNTIIFEDSEVGLRAAEESGAKYVRVYGYN